MIVDGQLQEPCHRYQHSQNANAVEPLRPDPALERMLFLRCTRRRLRDRPHCRHLFRGNRLRTCRLVIGSGLRLRVHRSMDRFRTRGRPPGHWPHRRCLVRHRCIFQNHAATPQRLFNPANARTQFDNLVFNAAAEVRIHCRPHYSTSRSISKQSSSSVDPFRNPQQSN